MDTVARSETVEKELDAFIERRSRKGETTADDVDLGYLESCRRFHERSEAEMRSRWIDYHQNMRRLHSDLADEHGAKAEKLLEPNGEADRGEGVR